VRPWREIPGGFVPGQRIEAVDPGFLDRGSRSCYMGAAVPIVVAKRGKACFCYGRFHMRNDLGRNPENPLNRVRPVV
jgi:hypothetical protein